MRSPDLGFPAFVVLLMVLLPVMLIAVIRLPEWQGSSEEDAGPAAHGRPTDAQARATATMARAEAMRPARRARGSQPGRNSPMPVPRRHEAARPGRLCGQECRRDRAANGTTLIQWMQMGATRNGSHVHRHQGNRRNLRYPFLAGRARSPWEEKTSHEPRRRAQLQRINFIG